VARFTIEFAESVSGQLLALTRAERVRVLDTVERQLVDEPLVETRNRKPLRPNPVAPWELRVGPMRVFYEVVLHPTRLVRVVAVGKKQRNVLRVGKREVKL
jgi:mRNA-degrading endonuclease RelE of RelBE toxin-antitoxin system